MDTELMWQIRGGIVLESRRLGLSPPIDGVYSQLEDDSGLRVSCERALRMGFAAKFLIHPRQLGVIQSVFGPDEARLESARRIVRVYETATAGGAGAVRLDGRMIDRPIVERARALLARWSTSIPEEA